MSDGANSQTAVGDATISLANVTTAGTTSDYTIEPTTAASVSISGRAVTTDGRGISNVLILLTDSSGDVRTTPTDSSGFYSFSDVPASETYIVTARGKRYTFAQPSQLLNVSDDTTEVNFIGNTEKRLKVL